MEKRKRNPFRLLPFLFLMTLFTHSLMAAGVQEEGWIYVKSIKKFESGGLMFESWEGVAITDSYNKSEDCDEKKYLCYTPKSRLLEFSVRPDNAKVVNFIRKKKSNLIFRYVKHRVEALKLQSRFEVVDVMEPLPSPPGSLPPKLLVHKTGSRNFSVFARILEFGYKGISVGTYEGLYLDIKRDKVHPFSVTDENMARYVEQAMLSTKPFHIGISVAIVTGFRKSDHDVFEINYNEEAGGVDIPPVPAKASPEKEDDEGDEDEDETRRESDEESSEEKSKPVDS